MSCWTYVTGVIEVDTCARSDAEAMYLAQTVVNHLPRITGSERSAEFHLSQPNGYCSSCNVDEFDQPSNLYDDRHFRMFTTQDRVLITIHGNLRDRLFKQTLHETTKMLAKLSSRLLVRECLVRVKSDMGETFIFDNPEWVRNRDLTNWTQKILRKDGNPMMDDYDILPRIGHFNDLMEPAAHLFPAGFTQDLKANGFFTAPASTKYHGAFEGGLFEHSRNVTQVLVALTKDNGLTWQRPESPYIVGMFHDLCKIDLYQHPMSDMVLHAWRPDGEEEIRSVDMSRWEHNPDTLLKGHGDKSIMLLSQYMQLTLEEILCIRYHMGAFVDRNEWNDYTRAIHQFVTVLWTHHADMIASHILEDAR